MDLNTMKCNHPMSLHFNAEDTINPLKCSGARQLYLKLFSAIQV